MWTNFRGPAFWEPHLERTSSVQDWTTSVYVFSSWLLQLSQITCLLTTISSAWNTLSPATVWLHLIPQLSANHSPPRRSLSCLYNLMKVLPAHIFFLFAPYCVPSYVLTRIVVTYFIGLLIQYLLPGCKLYGGQKPYLLRIPSRCLAHSRCPKGIC